MELVLNGTVYEIESYTIQDNGKRIVIPQKLKPKRKPATRSSSSLFNDLIKDLDGQYQKLSNDLQEDKSKPYKQDFR